MRKRRNRLSRIAREIDARFEELELAQRASALTIQELIALNKARLDHSQVVLEYVLDALDAVESDAAPKAAAILKDALSVGWGCARTVPSGKVDLLQAEVVAVEPTQDAASDRVIAHVLRPAVYLNHRAQPLLLRSAHVSIFSFRP